MKYVIRKVPERDTSILESILPDALICSDERHEGCIKSFVKALQMVDDDAVYVQDDMILAKNFRERVETAVAEHPRDVIVLSNFTHNTESRKVVSRGYYHPYEGCWLLCTYIPRRVGKAFVDFINAGAKKIPKGYFVREWDDVIFSRFVARELQEVVYVEVPNLAGHPANGSVTNPNREVRLTPNFDYADADDAFMSDPIYKRTMEYVRRGIFHEKRKNGEVCNKKSTRTGHVLSRKVAAQCIDL